MSCVLTGFCVCGCVCVCVGVYTHACLPVHVHVQTVDQHSVYGCVFAGRFVQCRPRQWISNLRNLHKKCFAPESGWPHRRA